MRPLAADPMSISGAATAVLSVDPTPVPARSTPLTRVRSPGPPVRKPVTGSGQQLAGILGRVGDSIHGDRGGFPGVVATILPGEKLNDEIEESEIFSGSTSEEPPAGPEELMLPVFPVPPKECSPRRVVDIAPNERAKLERLCRYVVRITRPMRTCSAAPVRYLSKNCAAMSSTIR